MRQEKMPWLRPHLADGVENFSLQRHLHHVMRPPIGHEKRVVSRDKQPEGRKAAEAANEFAALIEDLHAIVLAVADEEIALGIEPHRVRGVELALAGALFAPGEKKFSGLVKFHYPRVAIAIGDEEIAVGRKGDIGRLVE